VSSGRGNANGKKKGQLNRPAAFWDVEQKQLGENLAPLLQKARGGEGLRKRFQQRERGQYASPFAENKNSTKKESFRVRTTGGSPKLEA